MNIRLLIFMGLIAIIIASLSFTLYNLTQQPQEVITMPYTFSVKDKVGIVLDKDALHFGGGPVGATLSRDMNIGVDYNAKIHVKSIGPAVVIASKNDFVVNASQPQNITFSLIVPDLPLGKYEGELLFEVYSR